VTGASGAGVTTLGGALASVLSVPHLDTDDFYWLPSDPPFRHKREIPERLGLLDEALGRAPHGWVLSGSQDGWGDPLVPRFDVVVFLLVSTEVRLDRIRARSRHRYGDAALAPGGRMHEDYLAFLDWAATYDEGSQGGRSRPRHEAWLARLPCPVIRLEGVLGLDDMVNRVLGVRPPA
jgi:adenylate kinase family enzyme